jgi:DNA-binding winged helix-turn-helix (wHTH) protein
MSRCYNRAHLFATVVMSSQRPIAYEFGDFRLLPADKQLLRRGKPVPLKPKIFETLLLLVERQGRLIEKEEFLRQLWPDSFVEEVALAQNISQLRKALRNGAKEEEFIETRSHGRSGENANRDSQPLRQTKTD